MGQPLRVMMFAPRLPAIESLHFALRLARHGRQWADGSARQFHACLRRKDLITGEGPLRSGFLPLAELPPGREETGAASLADFAALSLPDTPPFDALIVPHAWLALPLGGPAAQPPAPTVVRFPHFAYLEWDYGLISDNARRDLNKLLASVSTFVFPSTWLRDRAVAQHGFPAARCEVILPASGHDGRTLDLDTVRRRYQLPERFLLTPPLMKRGYDGLAMLDAVAALRDRFGLRLPLLSVGPVLDECSGNPLAGTWQGRAFLERLEAAGLQHMYRALGNIAPSDWHAVVAAASCVVVLGNDLPEAPVLALDALALGTPLVYRDAPALAEALAPCGLVVSAHDNAEHVAEVIREAVTAPRPEPVLPRTADEEAAAYLRLAERLTQSRWHSRPRRAARPMVGRDARVAWLINHTTLRAFEVPLLRSLGLEVYSSKVIPNHSDFMSGSTDYSDDEHSTLPAWALDVLNRHNFYEKGATPEVLEVLNGFFGTVVSNYFGPNLASLVKGYTGRLVVRVFGREHPNNYSGYMSVACGDDFWENVWRMGERFWLGTCYETIPDIEGPILQKRSLYLPLGMPEASFRRGHTWRGNKRQILFVCPRINILPPYYTRIYQAFKASFGDLPHVIAGRQPTPVADDRVLGALDEDAYRQLFDESRVMFYHSREPRHLHYHPLEAVACGMPLVYMRGGVLEQYGGPNQPGACETYPEAREKLIRLLDGDEELLADILAAQDVLLERFRYPYNRRLWEEHFLARVLATPVVPDTYTSLTPATALPSFPPTPAADRPAGRPQRYWADLPATNDPAFADADALLRGLLRQGGEAVTFTLAEPRQLPPRVTQRRAGLVVSGLEKLAFRSRSRLVRGAARVALCVAYYTRATFEQRTLRPRAPEVMDALPFRVARWLGADVSKRERAAPLASQDYIHEPPPVVPLPLPPAPLSLEEMDQLLSAHAALLITHPFRRLDPNLPLSGLREKALAVVVSDLAQEFTSAWGEETAAMRREMVLWLRLARVVICGSEFLRQEVVRRYGVEPAKVRVIPRALLEEDTRAIDEEEIRRVREQFRVPPRYLIAPGDLDGQRNHLTALRALAALRRRGVAAPPVVLTGAWACAEGSAYAREWERFVRAGGLSEGEDYLWLAGVGEREQTVLLAGAAACLAVSSWQAEVGREVLQAAHHGVPLLAAALPCLTERIGPDEALFVASDDYEAVADAIEEVLANPEAARSRAERAADTVRSWTWQQAAWQYLAALRDAAEHSGEATTCAVAAA